MCVLGPPGLWKKTLGSLCRASSMSLHVLGQKGFNLRSYKKPVSEMGPERKSLDPCPRSLQSPPPHTTLQLPLTHGALVDNPPPPGEPGELMTEWCCGSHTGCLRRWAGVAPRLCSVTLGKSHRFQVLFCSSVKRTKLCECEMR